MKVNNSQNSNAASVASTKADKAAGTKGNQTSGGKGVLDLGSQPGATRIDLSPRAQEAKKAKDIAKGTPDIDEAKVAKFQALVDSGKYKVDSAALAEKMIAEDIKNMVGSEE